MSTLLQDFRYALRTLRKNMILSIVIVASLAIGIGANSAIFSVVDALLLRPLPYPQPDRLAAIWLHSPGIGIFRDWPSPGQYVDLVSENHSFEEIAIAQSRNSTLLSADEPLLVGTVAASSNLLRMLGAQPMLGRLFTPDEDKPGKPLTAILSSGAWVRLFHSDPNIVGKSITLGNKQFSIAGVLSPKFMLDFEVMPSEGPIATADIFLPMPLGADAAQKRGDENYNLIARLKPGVSVQQAQADVDIIAGRIREKDKRDRTFGMTVIGLQEQMVGDVRRALLVLLGSVTLVLLIACANVANLLLTRAAGREKEVAIRTALGAGWKRLMRQLLTESILLSLLGGLAGLAIAQLSLMVVRSMNPGNIPRLNAISIDGGVLAFTFGIAIVTGIVFGLAPAWRAMRVDLNTSLKSGGRGGQGDGGTRWSGNRLRGLLVVAELALSLMLLIGAGLLIGSFIRLQNVPPGFRADHVLTLRVVATDPKYRVPGAVGQFFEEIGNRIAHLPGVQAQGLASVLPLTGTVGWGGINVEGYNPPVGQELQVDLRQASSDYFRTMEIPLVEGRYFSEFDTPASQQVAIIDENFARRFWPHEPAIGKHLWFDPKKPFVIAGVVKVVKQYSLDDEGKIAVYFPYKQDPGNGEYVVVRSSSDAADLANAVTREIRAVDPKAIVWEVRTMEERVYNSMARQRFAATMLGAFAMFAMLLAAVGVYGVISYLVSQSRHDIGIRLALGAQPGQILNMVVRQGMELVGIGVVAGLMGAFALTRVMRTLLFGMSPTDPVTFSSIPAILAAVAFFAILIPAVRATKVDAMVVLREEK